MAAVSEGLPFRAVLPSLTIALFGVMVTWHVYYPGMLSPDSLDQYRQVLSGG